MPGHLGVAGVVARLAQVGLVLLRVPPADGEEAAALAVGDARGVEGGDPGHEGRQRHGVEEAQGLAGGACGLGGGLELVGRGQVRAPHGGDDGDRAPGGGVRRPAHAARPSTTEAQWPPKPKLFDTTWRSGSSRASCGT